MNPARPPAGTTLCVLEDLASPGAKGFVFREGDQMFAGFIVRDGPEVRGYVDSCPHAGSPLAPYSDRYLTRDGKFILCSAHGAAFLKGTGECISGPCYGEYLELWPVEVAGAEVVTA